MRNRASDFALRISTTPRLFLFLLPPKSALKMKPMMYDREIYKILDNRFMSFLLLHKWEREKVRGCACVFSSFYSCWKARARCLRLKHLFRAWKSLNKQMLWQLWICINHFVNLYVLTSSSRSFFFCVRLGFETGNLFNYNQHIYENYIWSKFKSKESTANLFAYACRWKRRR